MQARPDCRTASAPNDDTPTADADTGLLAIAWIPASVDAVDGVVAPCAARFATKPDRSARCRRARSAGAARFQGTSVLRALVALGLEPRQRALPARPGRARGVSRRVSGLAARTVRRRRDRSRRRAGRHRRRRRPRVDRAGAGGAHRPSPPRRRPLHAAVPRHAPPQRQQTGRDRRPRPRRLRRRLDFGETVRERYVHARCAPNHQAPASFARHRVTVHVPLPQPRSTSSGQRPYDSWNQLRRSAYRTSCRRLFMPSFRMPLVLCTSTVLTLNPRRDAISLLL